MSHSIIGGIGHGKVLKTGIDWIPTKNKNRRVKMCDNKKRLLIFHPTIAPYRVDFFNRLYEAFDTRICLQYWNLKNQKFDYQKIYDQFSFKPFYLPEGSKVKLLMSVLNQIREFNPDVVLVCEYGLITLWTLVVKFVMHRKYKIVIITDDSSNMILGNNSFSFRHKIARRLLAAEVDNVIAIEPKVMSWYQEKCGKGIWFPIIVDENKAEKNYQRILPISNRYVKEYNLRGKKILLFVGRLVDLKNLHRVIDAFAQCKTNATFVIVGDGPEREALEKHASQINKEVVFTGRFDDDELYAWYNLASVFILASYQEPFGAVTNEALLAGCRVIISERAGSSCLVDKTNGELINPMDVEEISSAIDRQLYITIMPNLTTVRKSMMTISFDERIDNLIKRIIY